MKILILSPLFPPDTGAPADYVKELVEKLTVAHDTLLLVYGYLPEAVTGADICSVDKRTPLPFRLAAFTKSLFSLTRNFDLILVNNAPSVELPLLLVSLIKKIPFVLIESDPIAKAASLKGFYKPLHTIISKRSKKIVTIETDASYKKPEILPFKEFNTEDEARRQTWWSTHINQLIS